MSIKNVIITDADGLAANVEQAMLLLHVSRAEVETRNIASALERLHVMTDDTDSILRYREALLFQAGGYDSDPREIAEIPEVRAYFKKLIQVWPHWLWYLCQGNGGIGLLLTLLCKVQVIRGDGSDFGVEFQDKQELAGVVADLLHRGNNLFVNRPIPEALIKSSYLSAIEDVQLT
jgi:hypothetical protein